MKIKFRRNFAEFSENYLATHYSGGVNSLTRLIGGPAIMVLSALIFVALNSRVENTFLRALLLLLTGLAILFGFFRTLSPLFNLFLVWLRRDILFSEAQALVEMELIGESIRIIEGDENILLEIEQLKSVQHRTESTWLLTEADILVSIPRDGIMEGDHEKFVAAIEEILYVDEEGEE